MSNVKNLTSKILKDAEERKDNILAVAEQDKEKILNKKNEAAKVLEVTMIEKAKTEAQTRKERIISGAELSARNEKLTAKQSVISYVFNKSIEDLCQMGATEFKSFVKENILSLEIAGDEKLILNTTGKGIIDNTFLKEVNDALTAKGIKGQIEISNKEGNFQGGFVLDKNGIEINNTFEALVSSLRDDLEFEVANVLFN